MNAIQSLFYGLRLPLQALTLILRKPKLIFWSLVPVILTLSISIFGVVRIKAYLVTLGLHWFAAHGLGAGTFTVKAATVLFSLTLYILTAILFVFLTGIIAAPFNDFLAESTEKYCVPEAYWPTDSQRKWKNRVRSIFIDIEKTAIITVLQLFLLALTVVVVWIPGLNLVMITLTFWTLAFQFVSYPQSRRAEGLRESVAFLFRHPFACAGFGAAFGFLFSIPFVSSLALPLAVVGGTLLYGRSKSGPGLR